MPFIFKKEDNTYVVYTEDAWDNYDSASFDITDNIVETLTSKSELSKFDIDITTDSDGNIEQSEYVQTLKREAEAADFITDIDTITGE